MTKQKASKKKFIITLVIIMVAIGVLIGAGLLLDNPVGNALKKTVGIQVAAPTFSFDEQTANGWWAADNYNTRENADESTTEPLDKLPVATRNIFQSKDTTVDSCFVMYAYYDYTADVDAMRKDREDKASNSSDLIYNKLPSQTLTMHTPEGEKSYDMDQYAITGTGSDQMQRGMSWGYVKLSNGYISINASCPEGEQLGTTAVGMSTISLVK